MHCSLKVKKKKKKKSYLSSLIKQTFPILFLSLRLLFFLLSFSICFFSLARLPTPSSLICSADPPQAPSPSWPDSQVPRWVTVVFSVGKLWRQASFDGWVGPSDLQPGHRCVRLRLHDSSLETWQRQPSKHSFFAIGAFSSQVYIAGRHDENKNMLEPMWVYDLRKDEWAKLTWMSQERDECEGMVIGWWFFLSCCGLLVVVVDDCAVLCW